MEVRASSIWSQAALSDGLKKLAEKHEIFDAHRWPALEIAGHDCTSG